jgi:hypothetical protein
MHFLIWVLNLLIDFNPKCQRERERERERGPFYLYNYYCKDGITCSDPERGSLIRHFANAKVYETKKPFK